MNMHSWPLRAVGLEEVQIDAEGLVADLDGQVLLIGEVGADPLALDERGGVVVDLLDPRQALAGPAQGRHQRMLVGIARPHLRGTGNGPGGLGPFGHAIIGSAARRGLLGLAAWNLGAGG